MKYLGCQLASHAEIVPEKGYPYYAEPKLDGFRILFHIEDDGSWLAYSRGANSSPFTANLKHVGDALVGFGLRNCIIDGEVSFGSWNETAKLSRLKSPTLEQMARIVELCVFHVFDAVKLDEIESGEVARRMLTVSRTTQRDRREQLRVWAAQPNWPKCAQITPCELVSTPAEAEEIHGGHVLSGFEGTMFKQPGASYVLDEKYRGQGWIAVKPTRTVDAVVTGFVRGQGKHAGRLGALEVRTAEGVEFNVGTGLTDVQRGEVWAFSEEYLGKWLEVRMQAGDVATARHPAFVRWRPDRDSAGEAE